MSNKYLKFESNGLQFGNEVLFVLSRKSMDCAETNKDKAL